MVVRAFDFAASNGHLELVRWLINRGAIFVESGMEKRKGPPSEERRTNDDGIKLGKGKSVQISLTPSMMNDRPFSVSNPSSSIEELKAEFGNEFAKEEENEGDQTAQDKDTTTSLDESFIDSPKTAPLEKTTPLIDNSPQTKTLKNVSPINFQQSEEEEGETTEDFGTETSEIENENSTTNPTSEEANKEEEESEEPHSAPTIGSPTNEEEEEKDEKKQHKRPKSIRMILEEEGGIEGGRFDQIFSLSLD